MCGLAGHRCLRRAIGIGQSARVPSSEDWLPIEYRDFYDFPRAFFVRLDDRWLYALSEFDDARGDFGDFEVFDMGDRGPVSVGDDWGNVQSLARAHLGQVTLAPDSFDPTRRSAVVASAFQPFSR